MLVAMFVALALVFCTSGCGGISASQSVSPASFFLPGILKANPATTNAPVAFMEKSVTLAVAK
jgi:hypothetical protein